MLDHNWLIDPTRPVNQKYKNEWFSLTVVAYIYDEVDDIIEIVKYH